MFVLLDLAFGGCGLADLVVVWFWVCLGLVVRSGVVALCVGF